MLPNDISIRDYSYSLPHEKIAQVPIANRDESKLLIYRKKEISETVFNTLPDYLNEHDLLVFNQTRVVHARLHFYTGSAARIEIFCLSPSENQDTAAALQQKGSSEWLCLIGNARKWKDSDSLFLKIENLNVTLKATTLCREADAFKVRFEWDNDSVTFAEILESAGKLPIPPYLNREPGDADEQRYQTVYAEHDGSVAAPTAGLHFTKEVLEKLKDKKIQSGHLTLHVGAGTFKPVKALRMDDHVMHSEEFSVSAELVEKIKNASGRIIPVGTTSLRTLESLYWLALKLLNGETSREGMSVGQWEPYGQKAVLPDRTEVFEKLYDKMQREGTSSISGHTKLLIAPGYKLRVADALITNFHQPESTLLLLVSAIVGSDWKKIYDYALDRDFRFLSYGDSSLLLP